MKVNYKREMNHNYLMIEEERHVNSYEARMMANNYIEGLLKFRIKKVDDRTYFCYEITSKQPLARLLESRNLQAQELRILVRSMARTLNRMEEYLLREEQVFAEPEYIYVEPELFSVEFCLIPGRSGDFPREFSKLLEYLLGKVDYQDQDCVVLAYGLYRESIKDNYGMEDLLRFLAHGEAPVTEEAKTWEEQEAETKEESNFLERVEERGDKSTFMQKLKRWFAERFRGSGTKKKNGTGTEVKKEMEALPWQMIFEEEQEEKPGEKDSACEKNLVALPPVESGGTVLLAERKPQVELRHLMSMVNNEPDICIAYYPFLIGKQESLVDYRLNKDTVSRLHLRIDEKGGDYWITDLNSTNGTMVAGQMLENNEVAQVNQGDEVNIGGIPFRFA